MGLLRKCYQPLFHNWGPLDPIRLCLCLRRSLPLSSSEFWIGSRGELGIPQLDFSYLRNLPVWASYFFILTLCLGALLVDLVTRNDRVIYFSYLYWNSPFSTQNSVTGWTGYLLRWLVEGLLLHLGLHVGISRQGDPISHMVYKGCPLLQRLSLVCAFQ